MSTIKTVSKFLLMFLFLVLFPGCFDDSNGSDGVVATPTFSVAAGTYTYAKSVTVSCETEDAVFYYTINGEDPTTSSTQYSGVIAVNDDLTLKVIAVKEGMQNSEIASAAYVIDYGTTATPTFSPPAGTYTSAQSVTISCATTGATIYYTTNGADPTTSSTVYTAAVAVVGDLTLKAIAVKDTLTNSAVASAVYDINEAAVSTPTFSPPEGAYESAQSVTISCLTAGATIYYTTNGVDPTTSSTVYSGAIAVPDDLTIKAIAVKSGLTNSAIASAEYIIATESVSLASATASSAYSASSLTADKAIDGNNATRWCTSDVTPGDGDGNCWTGWWDVQLSSATDVKLVSLYFGSAGSFCFNVQVSTDGTTYTTVKTESTAVSGNYSCTLTGTSGDDITHIKIQFLDGCSDWNNIYEMSAKY